MNKLFGLGILFLVLMAATAVSAFAAVPVLSPIPEQTVNEGALLRIALVTSATDNPATVFANFSVCQLASATGDCATPYNNKSVSVGATSVNISTLTTTTGELNWTPSFAQSGTYYFNVSVNDADSADTETVKVTVNDVPATLSVTSLELGGKNQERSNPNADDDEDKNVNVTGIVTIKNTGGDQLTGLSATVTGLGKYASKFATQNSQKVVFASTTLAPGASTTATVEMRVPENLDAVDNSQTEVAFEVAQITFTGTAAGSSISPATSTVKMQAENNLKFKSGKLSFDSKSEKVNDDDTVDKIKPGMSLELALEVESKFKDKDAVDIQDVQVVVESTGDEDDLDVDEDEDLDDVGPEDTETVSFDFNVEDDAQRGKEDLLITLEGVDENGAKHGERWTLALDIEREDHEIGITGAVLSPSSVSCQESTDLDVQIRNTGRGDEKNVFIRVYSPELKYQNNIELGEVSENDEESRKFTIPVAKDLAAGTYRVTVETYYDVSTKSVTDAEILTKQDCGAAVKEAEKKVEEQKKDIVVVPVDTGAGKQDSQQPPVTGQITKEAEKAGFFEGNGMIALLVLGYIVVIGAGVLFAIKLLRK